MLGNEDVEDVITLPSANLEWTIMCAECNELSANFSCQGVFYCEGCWKTAAEAGRVQEDSKSVLGLCIECGYQIGTRHCNDCDDDYCDSCYASKHRRGRRMHHTWEPLVEMCTLCRPELTAVAARAVLAASMASTHRDRERARHDARRCCYTPYARQQSI